MGAGGDVVEDFLIAGVIGGDTAPVFLFDLDELVDFEVFGEGLFAALHPGELDGSGFGAEGFASLLIAEFTALIGFEFLVPANERALGSGFVAGEIAVELLVLFGPVPGVAGEVGFDLLEVFRGALKMPVGEGGFFDQGDFVMLMRVVLIEPVFDGGGVFGGIFVGQDGYFGAAAVGEAVQGGFGFAFRGAGAGGAARFGGDDGGLVGLCSGWDVGRREVDKIPFDRLSACRF